MIDVEAMGMEHGLEQDHDAMDDDDLDVPNLGAKTDLLNTLNDVEPTLGVITFHGFWEDFNAIVRGEERIGGSMRSTKIIGLFQDSIFDSGLIDIDYVGSNFTWRGGTFHQRECFGHIGKWKKDFLARLRGIDKALQRGYSGFLLDLEKHL
ncbi:hypothetical protein V6N12_047168 [Hibiscus sabdariffa]|uniref:Uncharacterized protein n=1 Tax=Hibiscus sabdariffa TaxID=183260 RepID=A0ABR2DBT9_9ROSI